MVRLGKCRGIIREIAESPSIEKLSFILPFFVIVIDILIIEHAIREHLPPYIIGLTSLLFILSLIEIAVVLDEIHEHYSKTNFQRILTIKLDDFIIKKKKRSVKRALEDFIQEHPEYTRNRHEVYHLVCSIMETHKEKIFEETLKTKLEQFIRISKKKDVDSIMKAFMRSHPEYKGHPGMVYKFACQILGMPMDNTQNNLRE
jgi:hypothetical protein